MRACATASDRASCPASVDRTPKPGEITRGEGSLRGRDCQNIPNYISIFLDYGRTDAVLPRHTPSSNTTTTASTSMSHQPSPGPSAHLHPSTYPPQQQIQSSTPSNSSHTQTQPGVGPHPSASMLQNQNPNMAMSRQKLKSFTPGIGIAAGAEDAKYKAKYKELRKKVKEIEAVCIPVMVHVDFSSIRALMDFSGSFGRSLGCSG